MNQNLAIFQCQRLTRRFGKTVAVHDVSFDFQQSGQYVILGASGSGKSSLLYLLGALDRPNEGAIFFEGKDIGSLHDEELAAFRNEMVGFVFQFHFLLPSMNAIDNIMLTARIGHHPLGEVKDRVHQYAERLGLTDLLKKFPYQLSGGEQQRVNLLRAVSTKPRVLLCDEPTGNLDSKNSEIVMDLIQEIAAENGTTLIVVTHDLNIAKRFQHQLQMVDGSLAPLS